MKKIFKIIIILLFIIFMCKAYPQENKKQSLLPSGAIVIKVIDNNYRIIKLYNNYYLFYCNVNFIPAQVFMVKIDYNGE